MAGYSVVADVSGLTPQQIQAKGTRIKRLLEKHNGLVKRTGHLSNTSFVVVYPNGLMACGASAHYASYLSLGQGNLKKSYPYIRRAVIRILGEASIVGEGVIQ